MGSGLNSTLVNQQRQGASAVREIYARECQACGVCCMVHSQLPFNIAVGNAAVPPKLVQIGPRQGRSRGNRFVRIAPLKDKQFNGGSSFSKCAALVGKLRQAVGCGIYEVRPACCRNYDPGSPACRESRRWASMEDPPDIFELGHS